MGTSAASIATPADTPGIELKLAQSKEALRITAPQLNRARRGDVGLELEFNIVDSSGRPIFHAAQHLLDFLSDKSPGGVVGELGSWQGELNLTPQRLANAPFTAMQAEAETMLAAIAEIVARLIPGAKLALAGTLPTHVDTDFTMANVSQVGRYRLLNEGVWPEGAQPTRWVLPGQRQVVCDSVAPEMSSTSTQLHLLTPAHIPFKDAYNACVATAAIAAAGGTNAPWWLGLEAGHDIRYALFRASTRKRAMWEVTGRYVNDDLEPYLAALDTTRYRPIVTQPDFEDPIAIAKNGDIPQLLTARTQNGSVWPMLVRAIYDGTKQHFRLELRYTSAGPTVADNLATYAFHTGLILNPRVRYEASLLPYDLAIANMNAVDRCGIDAVLYWPNEFGHIRQASAASLTLRLLPEADRGLRNEDIHGCEVRHYLSVIARRARKHQTGSTWQLSAVQHLRHAGLSQAEAVSLMFWQYRLNAAAGLGKPVCDWQPMTRPFG